VVTGTDPFFAKDGVTAGQAATIVLDVPKHTGVVVLSNAFPVNRDHLRVEAFGARTWHDI
jgi:hypothetical protein